MLLEKTYRETGNSTDKYDLGYISEFYDKLFSPIKNQVTKVLEIGIYHGQSVVLWNNFFTNAEIHCVDIQRFVDLSAYQKIIPYYENAYSTEFVNKFEKGSFDIIIDDGPHTYESMVFFLNNYLDLVKPGGILILEDIIDRAWTPELLKLLEKEGLTSTVYDMRNKQKTEWLYNRWAGGLDVIVVNKN